MSGARVAAATDALKSRGREKLLNHANHQAAEGPAASVAASTTGPVRAAQAGRAVRRMGRRWLLLPAAVLPLLALALVLALALTWEGVYPGVHLGGVELGGLDRAAAAAHIEAEATRWEATELFLTAPQGTYLFTREGLGMRYDRDATLAAVLGQGRGEGAPGRLAAIARLARDGGEVVPVFTVDEGMLRDGVRLLAGETDIEPRDGDLHIEAGRLIVTPPVEGRGLDVEAAVALVRDTARRAGATDLTLPVAERIQPRLNAAALAPAQARAEALLATPIELVGAGVDLRIGSPTIGSWLAVRRDPARDTAAPLTIEVQAEPVRALVAPLAGRVYREARNAEYEFRADRGGFVVTTPELREQLLDTDNTVAAILAALETPERRLVYVATRSRPPALTSRAIAAANREATGTYLAGPLVFVWEARRWEIPVEQLAAWLTIEPAPGRDAARLRFDEDALERFVVGLKPQINQPALDATYTMDDGADVYRLTGASRAGRNLDGPATYTAAITTLTTESRARSERMIALPIATIRPKVTEADVAALVPERWIDVDLTTQRMNAVVGKKVVHTAIISSGKKDWETPTGTFHIIYRVENETMTSGSIGAETEYRLENVLYTQYFTNEGHALHYSWWKEPGSFGTPSSHGCLSETLKDAEFFWNFARVGTRVTIHGKTPIH